MEDEFEPVGDEVDAIEGTVAAQLAATAMGPLSQRQDSIAHMFVDPDNIEVLSHFNSWQEVMNYAKADYLVKVMDAIGRQDIPDHWETVGNERVFVRGGFKFPDFSTLLFIDMRLRNSKAQQTRIHLRDITKIFERGDGGRKGWLGRR